MGRSALRKKKYMMMDAERSADVPLNETVGNLASDGCLCNRRQRVSRIINAIDECSVGCIRHDSHVNSAGRNVQCILDDLRSRARLYRKIKF